MSHTDAQYRFEEISPNTKLVNILTFKPVTNCTLQSGESLR